jgi:hypothetical protein
MAHVKRLRATCSGVKAAGSDTTARYRLKKNDPSIRMAVGMRLTQKRPGLGAARMVDGGLTAGTWISNPF